jgi:hypothetical protein
MKYTCLFFIILCGCGCLLKGDAPPNVRVIPGIELCGKACDKMRELDVKNANEDCKPYYADMVVDNQNMTCAEFCEYEMQNSVDMQPKCIIDNVEVCSVDMSAKCGL